MTIRSTRTDKSMRLVIGWVLRLGVFISMVVVCLGGAVYLYRHGHSLADYAKFKVEPDFVQPSGILSGIAAFRGRAIIQAGIILLIATPVLRVIFSAVGFIIEKDRLYTIISLIVLFIIIFSMIGGHAG